MVIYNLASPSSFSNANRRGFGLLNFSLNLYLNNISTTTAHEYSNTNLCYYRLKKVLLALLVTYFLCSNWPCYYRLVYCNTSTCLQEHLSSGTMIFAVTFFFALVTLQIMVECKVCNTFIYLSEHLPSVTGIVYCHTFFSSSNISTLW
jgi:hypothetical protein